MSKKIGEVSQDNAYGATRKKGRRWQQDKKEIGEDDEGDVCTPTRAVLITPGPARRVAAAGFTIMPLRGARPPAYFLL